MKHELKIWPLYFDMVESGDKPFELRKNDRNFQVNDELLLREWDAVTGYTGRRITAEISCVLEGEWLAEGYCALGLANVFVFDAPKETQHAEG